MANENQSKGMGHQAKGAVKEAAGKVSGNDKLEGEGKLEKAGGKVQKKAGDAEEQVKKDR